MKYAHIHRSRHLWPVRLQCDVLGVSFTGFHQPLQRQRVRVWARYHQHCYQVYAATQLWAAREHCVPLRRPGSGHAREFWCYDSLSKHRNEGRGVGSKTADAFWVASRLVVNMTTLSL